MVVLVNLGPKPLKVEYVSASHNKGFFKTLPVNAFVAMKDLNHSTQISNRNALATKGVTIYNFESATYFYKNPATPTGATLPFVFVGNNQKPSEMTSFTSTGLTAGYNRLKSMM